MLGTFIISSYQLIEGRSLAIHKSMAKIRKEPVLLQKQTIYQKKACQRTCRKPLTYYKINSSIQPNICSSNLVHSVVSCCTASFQIHWDSQHNTYFESSITILQKQNCHLLFLFKSFPRKQKSLFFILRWFTCVLVSFSWLLDHVIYLNWE